MSAISRALMSPRSIRGPLPSPLLISRRPHALSAGIGCADSRSRGGGGRAECGRCRDFGHLAGDGAEMNSRSGRGQVRMILIGAALLLSLGMGIRQSLGLFLTPVTRDLGLAAADFTLAIAMQNIVWGLSQAPVGALADRYGLRVTLIAGAAIYVVGLVIMALAGGTAALLVSGGFIGIALSCTASSLAMTATARAVPEERRSKTLGIVSAAGSLGTLLVPLATQGLLAHEPWQIGALFFLVLALVMLPAGFWAGGAD